MYICKSEISCGVNELIDVGQLPDNEEYFDALKDQVIYGERLVPFLLASVPCYWKKSIKWLKAQGFKQIARAGVNPNSGNEIVVFLKRFTKKEINSLIKKIEHIKDSED